MSLEPERERIYCCDCVNQENRPSVCLKLEKFTPRKCQGKDKCESWKLRKWHG